jgi:Ca2+-binding EF-hand superfamily protein
MLPLSKEYAGLLLGRQEFYSTRSQNTSDYFNLDTRNELRILYKSILQNLRMTECLRLRISRRPNFSYRSAFEYADKDKDGFIGGEDLREMLAENSFFATEREINSVMNKFDRDGDGKIAFNEFVDEMSPKL